MDGRGVRRNPRGWTRHVAASDLPFKAHMATEQNLERGRTSFAQKAWADAYRLLDTADRSGALAAGDLERLAAAASLTGRDEESEAAWARAHQCFLDRGDVEGAARCATWLGFGLLQRAAIAPASGWFARAERLLDEANIDCVVRGYLLIPSAIRHIAQGAPEKGHAVFERAAEIARRFDDRDLASIACHGRGRALIRLGNISEGVARLDEAMAAVIAGAVSPTFAGDVYCSVLEGCQETFDVRRAYEWTASLAQWCAAQPGLVRYRGECLLYRAEVLQLRGKWGEAAHDAQHACELLMSRPVAGAAFYRLGEVHRLRGEYAKAETAYARANERGRTPQPGLSLLRLAQGQVDTATASIRSVLLDTKSRAPRARALVAAVEILLAAHDLEGASAAAAELSDIAIAVGAPLLDAACAHANGAVLLATENISGAAALLGEACEGWRDLSMPYDEAQTRLLLAAVCERRGDADGHRLEIDAARRLFKELGAEHCLTRHAEQTEPARHAHIGPLSEREVQVLRLLAAGKTNREVAGALFISEKTVARHVSNIFDKLGVSSRTRATAWAYEHKLI
jgi:DNA-binding CsgD family transcriptional regulator